MIIPLMYFSISLVSCSFNFDNLVRTLLLDLDESEGEKIDKLKKQSVTYFMG